MSGFLLDVNVLLAALHPRHVHSVRATEWIAAHPEPGGLAVCRVSQMGALRLLTTPSVMGADLRTASDAWAGWEIAVRDERFRFLPEPDDLEERWRTMTEAMPSGARVDTDSYLAAFALATGLTMATFDNGFGRYAGLSVETL